MTEAKSKIIFLDLDGPMIPGRAYTMPKQTKPLVKMFDPCAVGILNNLCKQSGWKIVLHTSWIKFVGGPGTLVHCIGQGLKGENFHEEAFCSEDINWRYTRVAEWLSRHPETTHYLMLDDEPYSFDMAFEGVVHPADLKSHLILVDFNDGIITQTVNKIRGGDWRVTRD